MDSQNPITQPIPLKGILKEKEFWGLIFLGVLYFYRPLFLGETLFLRDLHSFFIPQKQLLVDFFKVGELPLWNPYLNGGQPYLADISNSTLYPLNLLFLFFPLFRAFNISIAFHVIFCAVAVYAFARIIGLQPLSSFITGLIYGFCGYTLSLTNLLAVFFDMPYIPLLLLFWHLFLRDSRRRWFILTIAAGVLQTLNGSHDPNVITILLLLGWTLVYPYPSRTLSQKIRLWFLLCVFIIGIGLIQIVPTIEMFSLSSRGQGKNYTIFSAFSLHPKRLPEMIFPGFLGYVETLSPDTDYWGGALVDQKFPFIFSIYFGCVTIIFGCIGGLHNDDGNTPAFPFKVRTFLLSVFAVSLFFAFGRFLPFFQLLYEYIPLINIFRYPIKTLIAGIFPIALLVGYTAELYFTPSSRSFHQHERTPAPKAQERLRLPSLKTLGFFWGIVGILWIFTLTFLFSEEFSTWFQEVFFTQSETKIAHQGLTKAFIHTSTIWLLVTLLCQYRRFSQKSWQYWLFGCVLIIDFFSAGERIIPSAPEEIFTDPPPVVQLVQNEIGNGRLFHHETLGHMLKAPSNEILWRYRWNLEVLYEHLGAFYRFPVIFHVNFTGLTPVYPVMLTDLLNTLPWEQKLSILSAGGVKMMITSEKLSISGIRYIAEIPNRSTSPFYLYQNDKAAKRVEFVTVRKIAGSDDEALKMIIHPGYDPREQVILQEPKQTLFSSFFARNRQNDDDLQLTPQPCHSLKLQINKEHSSFHSALFSVSNSCDGYLVFTDPFYPGWHISIDGKATPILRANVAFSAIFLQAGEHKIERRYRPNSVLFGTLASFISGCVLLILTYKGSMLKIK